MESIIYKQQLNQKTVEIKVGSIYDFSHYKTCLEIRKETYSKKEEYKNRNDYFSLTDLYSLIFVYYVDSNPIGTLTITDSSKGVLDCQEYYPQNIIGQKGVWSSNKFGIIKNFRIEEYNTYLSTYLLHLSSEYCCMNGLKVDIINVAISMIRYYNKLGYFEIPNYIFIHPVFQNKSTVMVKCFDKSYEETILISNYYPKVNKTNLEKYNA